MLQDDIKQIAEKRFELGERNAYSIMYSKLITASLDYYSENEKDCKEILELIDFVEQILGLKK